jgi:hypothetical protein
VTELCRSKLNERNILCSNLINAFLAAAAAAHTVWSHQIKTERKE